jgi:formamidopyrimidine-DNA glycosylase
MPELPEVETVVRGLREPLIGRRVEGVWYDLPKVIATPGADEFAARIHGQTFRAINRRAKYILSQLDTDILAIHLKMTGRLYVHGEPDPWVRLRLDLDDNYRLYFSDARRFGRVYLADDVLRFAPDLGPEPLEDGFTVDVLRARLHGRHKAIKALLLDQSFIAGLGNIYADEALHRAGIHPLQPAYELSDEQVRRLYGTIRDALRAGIDYEGASINWYRKPNGERGESQDHFLAYGRTGEPCLVCGQPIEKMRVAQRGTHFCPACQPLSSKLRVK